MQALQIPAFHPSSDPFSALRLSTIPIPTPKPTEYLVRITHTSPQRVDLLYARGLHQNNNSKHGHIHPPFTLGLDFAGIVITSPTTSSTSEHASLVPGTRVMGSSLGAFAEFITAPASAIQAIPNSLSNSEACAAVSGIVSFATVVDVAEVKEGISVLVTGLPGALGMIAAQIAKARGAKVFALARTEERARRLEVMLEGIEVLGADEDWVERIRERTRGQGVDVVIDHVGVVEEGLRALRFGGLVVVVGFAGEGPEKIRMDRVLVKGARVVGYRFGESGRRGLGMEREEMWTGYMDLLERGAVRPVVDERLYRGLDSVTSAMQDMETGKLFGKAIVTVHEEGRSKL